MFVSSYQDAFQDAFKETLAEIDVEPFESSVKKIVSRLAEDVVDRVHDDVRDRLITSIEDSISAKAAEVATRMIEHALCGDEAEIRNLMGFYSYPAGSRKHMANSPYYIAGWKLLMALMDKRPDIFVDERIAMLNELLAAEKDKSAREMRRAHWWQAQAEGREPDPQNLP